MTGCGTAALDSLPCTCCPRNGPVTASSTASGSARPSPPSASPARSRRAPAQFALLADPTRLTLLTCIKAAGPISVSDLAAATGINDTTVSQTLRYLRATQTVTAERDGRVIRYQLASTAIAALLPERLAAAGHQHHPHAEPAQGR